MSTTYTIISWGVTLALVLGAIHIYNPALIQKLLDSSNAVQAAPASNNQISITKRPKANKSSSKQNTLEVASSVENLSGKEARTSKKRKITGPAGVTATHTADKSQDQDEEHTVNDSDFAQQLKKAQSGTKLQSKPQPKASIPNRLPEDKKNTTQNPLPLVEEAKNGGSSKQSAIPVHTPSSKDISDMLDAPASGPATLRLTNIATDSGKQSQAKKQFEPVPSKKKRNEQKKREEQKREIEESNQLWEKKKQEQLRTARMAAGTSNQIKANSFTNTVNAWQNQPQIPSAGDKMASVGPLLDTFEKTSSKSTAPSVQTISIDSLTSNPPESNNVSALKASVGEKRTSALAASAREQGSSEASAFELSEESQIQRLRDQDREEAWESVTSKKTKKKNKAENDTGSDTSSVPPPPPVRSTLPKPNTNGTKVNGVAKSKEDMNRFQSIQTVESTSGLHDDEWTA